MCLLGIRVELHCQQHPAGGRPERGGEAGGAAAPRPGQDCAGVEPLCSGPAVQPELPGKHVLQSPAVGDDSTEQVLGSSPPAITQLWVGAAPVKARLYEVKSVLGTMVVVVG